VKGNVLHTPEDNRRMFDRIARRYDLLNRLLSLGLDRRWRRLAVRSLSPAPGSRCLDVGAGTGDLSIEIVRQAPGAEVVGIDPASGMLDLGRAKVARAGLTERISLQVADVCDLPFEDETFTGVITAFTFRNIEDRQRALREMARVLHPGGKLAILELTSPEGAILRMLHRSYNRWIVPAAGRLLSSGEAYEYLFRSIEEFPPPERVVDAMAEAGLRDRGYAPLSGGVVTLFTAVR
jgi:demethylmenaquinone methyltransferase/2-methoxy-6-polyprenyl-1,4-benzoquinol methylase